MQNWVSKKASDTLASMIGVLVDKVKAYALSPEVQNNVVNAAKKQMQRAIDSAQNMMFDPENQKKILAFTETAIDRAKVEFDKHQPESLKKMHRIAVAVTVVALIVLVFMIIGGVLSYVALSRALNHSNQIEAASLKLKTQKEKEEPQPQPQSQPYGMRLTT